MEPKDLIKGLSFAMRHKLSKREIELVCLVLTGVKDTDSLAKAIGGTHMAVHQTVIKLKRKNIIKIEGLGLNGRNVYGLDVID